MKLHWQIQLCLPFPLKPEVCIGWEDGEHESGASEHCVIRSSQCKQCALTILLDYMILFTSDYLVNLVKRLRVYVKVIMQQVTQMHVQYQLYQLYKYV